MLRIDALEIDDHILEKIEVKHGVSWHEVEEACFSPRRHVRRGRDGLYKVFSQTEAGRYLLVVLAHLYESTWKLVTARDLTSTERRLYQTARGETP